MFLISFRKNKGQKFTDLNIEKHMLHSRKLLSNLTQKALQTAFFSDKKILKKREKSEKTLYSPKNVIYVLKKNEESRGALGKIILRN